MENLFCVENPFGETICLSARCFDAHIVRRRKQLKGRSTSIKQTIEEPDVVTQDKDFEERHCYYRQSLWFHKPTLWLKVVVDTESREVVTAFTVQSLHDEELILYENY